MDEEDGAEKFATLNDDDAVDRARHEPQPFYHGARLAFFGDRHQ